MSLSRYAGIVVAVAVGTLLLLWPLLSGALDAPARRAMVLGSLLAALNTLAAYFLVQWSSGRPPQVFLKAVLGGMLGRMMFMLAAFLTGAMVFDVPKVPFAISLLSYFVCFLFFELSVLSRHSLNGSHRS